jgi:hypothetical protein
LDTVQTTVGLYVRTCLVVSRLAHPACPDDGFVRRLYAFQLFRSTPRILIPSSGSQVPRLMVGSNKNDFYTRGDIQIHSDARDVLLFLRRHYLLHSCGFKTPVTCHASHMMLCLQQIQTCAQTVSESIVETFDSVPPPSQSAFRHFGISKAF